MGGVLLVRGGVVGGMVGVGRVGGRGGVVRRWGVHGAGYSRRGGSGGGGVDRLPMVADGVATSGGIRAPTKFRGCFPRALNGVGCRTFRSTVDSRRKTLAEQVERETIYFSAKIS